MGWVSAGRGNAAWAGVQVGESRTPNGVVQPGLDGYAAAAASHGQRAGEPTPMPNSNLLLALALATSALACQPTPQTASPVAQAAKVLSPEELLQGILAEHQALEAVFLTSPAAAKGLGALNGKLQQQAYFRRVPTQPALDSAEASLRQLATAKSLLVVAFTVTPPAELPQPQPTKLAPGQRWQPTLDELRGVLKFRLDLQGSMRDAAGFIDALPSTVDRLVVISSHEALPGGVRLLGELYYEKPLPPPELSLSWPALQERLATAGWKATEGPALQAQLQANPKLAEYAKQVELGHQRVPDVRRTLQITADFPRWLLRWSFFEERAKAVQAVQGTRLLGL